MRVLRKWKAESFYFGYPLGEMRLVKRVFKIFKAFQQHQRLHYHELCDSAYLFAFMTNQHVGDVIGTSS